MRCRELKNYLEDWLEEKTEAELIAHLRSCPRCRLLAEEVRRLAPLLRTLHQEPPALDASFWARLRQRIESANQRQEAFWHAFNQLAERAAAVLAVLLLALSLLALWQPLREPLAGIELAQEASGLTGDEMTRDQILLSLAETEAGQ